MSNVAQDIILYTMKHKFVPAKHLLSIRSEFLETRLTGYS